MCCHSHWIIESANWWFCSVLDQALLVSSYRIVGNWQRVMQLGGLGLCILPYKVSNTNLPSTDGSRFCCPPFPAFQTLPNKLSELYFPVYSVSKTRSCCDSIQCFPSRKKLIAVIVVVYCCFTVDVTLDDVI